MTFPMNPPPSPFRMIYTTNQNDPKKRQDKTRQQRRNASDAKKWQGIYNMIQQQRNQTGPNKKDTNSVHRYVHAYKYRNDTTTKDKDNQQKNQQNKTRHSLIYHPLAVARYNTVSQTRPDQPTSPLPPKNRNDTDISHRQSKKESE